MVWWNVGSKDKVYCFNTLIDLLWTAIVFPSKQAVEQAQALQQQYQRQKKKAKKDQDTDEPQIPTPIVQKFGRVDKNAAVQHLCWGTIDGKRLVSQCCLLFAGSCIHFLM